MATNANVVNAWKSGKAERSDNGNIRTDGDTLWSYQMRIGRTTEDGRKVALHVAGKHNYSMTTSQHVGMALRVADKVVIPVHTSVNRASWREFPLDWARQEIPVEPEEAEAPELTFVCNVQDPDALAIIQEYVGDETITAAAFGTHTGEYWPLYIRRGFPSYRKGGEWFRFVKE